MKTINIFQLHLSTTGFWIRLFNRGFAITCMSKGLFFFRHNPSKYLKIGNCYIYFLRG
jgi:hypothetical protein